MIRINLLPLSERRSTLALGRIFAIVSGFVLLFCVALYGYGFYTELTLQEQIRETRNRYELLRPTQEKMMAANEKQQMINSKNAILLALTNERKSWHAVLARLGNVTPPSVWLTDMEAAQKNILLKGMAVNYPDLASYMQKISQDTLFAEPILIRVEQDSTLPVTRFELSVKIKGM